MKRILLLLVLIAPGSLSAQHGIPGLPEEFVRTAVVVCSYVSCVPRVHIPQSPIRCYNGGNVIPCPTKGASVDYLEKARRKLLDPRSYPSQGPSHNRTIRRPRPVVGNDTTSSRRSS